MKQSKKSWVYRVAYPRRSKKPDAVNILRFCLDFILGILLGAIYWLVMGTICFLFAARPAKQQDREDFIVCVTWWPRILGQRVWPVSLIVLSFLVWPLINFNSWKSWKEVSGSLTFFSFLVVYGWLIFRIGDSQTWKKISERTKIVFTENGGT